MFINFHFWTHITSLTPPLFIEVCFPSQYICIWGINFTAVFTIFRLDLETVLTVWYSLLFIL
jgi:hypothetical protein